MNMLNRFKSLFTRLSATKGKSRPRRYSKNAWSYRVKGKPTAATALYLSLGARGV
ncbi:hypothetical protein HPC38_01070 [Pasteurellaceae bacterium HPA106]|uniref:hypothetical protein n=1 Tax=Spirabiliibacterium pneumoniae TaxID=221400 RepID=UPI001AADBD0D|nr:hypothetical protein [Spirabiliibacterium pneumoniae]MBE2895472.1 hypothetical protein [Spirabiliibacterium pneumoniae]